jgi:hypothetical protein
MSGSLDDWLDWTGLERLEIHGVLIVICGFAMQSFHAMKGSRANTNVETLESRQTLKTTNKHSSTTLSHTPPVPHPSSSKS